MACAWRNSGQPQKHSVTRDNIISSLAVIMESSIFWDITPCSPFKISRWFGWTCRLQLQGRRISQARDQCESRWQAEDLAFRLVSRSTCTLTLMMGAIYSPQTSVDIQRTALRHIPEDGTLMISSSSLRGHGNTEGSKLSFGNYSISLWSHAQLWRLMGEIKSEGGHHSLL
jgi:hypothetical protein